MNIVERARSKWNKQANEYNQWIHLGTEEKLDLIIAEYKSDRAMLEEMSHILLLALNNGEYHLCRVAPNILREGRDILARAKARLE